MSQLASLVEQYLSRFDKSRASLSTQVGSDACTHGKAAAKDERANEFAASADAEYRGYCLHVVSVYRATLLAPTLAEARPRLSVRLSVSAGAGVGAGTHRMSERRPPTHSTRNVLFNAVSTCLDAIR